MRATGLIRNLAVPRALLADPDGFGGAPVGDCQRGDLVVREGRIAGMTATAATQRGRGLLLPRLCEPHVHLDKCHTIDRIGSRGGTLQEAIAAQSKDKAHWTADDLRQRMTRGLDELVAAGCGRVRSHVDWLHGSEALAPPEGWHILCELAQERRAEVALQISPLLGVEDFTLPGLAEALGPLFRESGAALGCFVYDQPKRREGIAAAFEMAQRYDLMLDFHVDEGLDEGLDGLDLIAEQAIESAFDGPILCGHACSLVNSKGAELARKLDRIAQAGITVAVLPSTNLYLQGRGSGTPDRRGLTRVQELQAAGIPVIVGTDNVRDAFCPLGRHDPRLSLSLAVMAAHLDPPFGPHLPMITHLGEAALGAEPTRIEGADLGDLLLFPETDTSEFLCGTDAPRPLSTLKMEPLS